MKKSAYGFTLIELLIGVGLTSITVLVGVSLMTWSAKFFNSSAGRMKAEHNLLRASHTLSQQLLQAMNIRAHSNAALENYSTNSDGEGRIRPYDSSTGIDGLTHTIAVFVRETQGSQLPGSGLSSVFRGAGIFYQRPTATTSGVIYFDSGLRPNNPNVVNVSPGREDSFWGRFVELQVQNLNLQTTPPPEGTLLRSVEVRLVARYFLGSDTSNEIWCPSADIISSTAGCANSSLFKDIENRFTVYFRNNHFGGNEILIDTHRLHGPIHFFKMGVPGGF